MGYRLILLAALICLPTVGVASSGTGALSGHAIDAITGGPVVEVRVLVQPGERAAGTSAS